MTLRAVLDTNVVVSGIFWNGAPGAILEAWSRRRFVLCISPPILEEYRRVTQELAGRRPLPAAQAILETIARGAETVEPVQFEHQVCDDPDDDTFLATAVAARAQFVVSGDRALLRVQRYRSVVIVKPRQFLTHLH